MSERTDQIVAIARSWIGTPYHHQAAVKGVGCDCIGLVRGVFAELYGYMPDVPPYSEDWGDSNGNEGLLIAGFTYLEPVALLDRREGDVIALRWRQHLVAKHAMILTGPDRAIHSYQNATVTEIYLSSWWTSKIVQVFRYPEGS